MPRYEIVDLGVTSPDYFQGFGTAYTGFENCVTGIGDNAKAAYEDALDNLYQTDSNADRLRLPRKPRGIRKRDRVPAGMEDAYYYVGIRW